MRKPHTPPKVIESKQQTSSSIWGTFVPYGIIFLLSLLPLIPFFQAGLPITHDGKDHIARIANFYQNLQDGVIIPRWAENLNWGYGHPVLMFLYPLPSYFASVFHFLGFTFIDSVKAVFIIAYIASGMTMYVWISKVFNKYAGFTAAILYLFAPYRFVDLHVRGAFGEHVAFMFIPLVMYYLYILSQKKQLRTVGFGALSIAGLLLSHNAISIMFLPIFLLYAVFLLHQDNNKRVFAYHVLLLFALGFALSAFFLIPALLEGKYTLRNIVTSNDYASRFVPVSEFFYSPWSFGGTNSLSKQIGIIHWIVIIATIAISWVWYKQKNIYWKFGMGNLLLFVASLFIMTSYSQFIWDRITILQNFQFPWRFLTVTVFLTAVCGALCVNILQKNLQRYAAIGITVLVLFVTSGNWGVNGYLQKPDMFFSDIYEGTTDTGESAPIWSVRFMEKRPKAHLEVIEGTGDIQEGNRTTVNHSYIVTTNERIRLRENTLYFPGWEIYVDNVMVQPEFQDPKHRGLMTFFVEKGSHTIEVIFKETKIRLFANTISALALVIVGFFCIIKVDYIWKRFL